MKAIFTHELRSSFRSLSAWVFASFLLCFVGIGAMMYNIQAAVSNFEYVLSLSCLAFVVIAPILTMRVLAEERRQRTDQLLYALPDHEGAITSADMQVDSPYNLYQHAGLPPTPISNPGLASIDAALNPNDTDYYYYALGSDGLHHFSTTLAEHNAFVNSSSYGG